MTENREQSRNSYSLATAEMINALRTRPRLTVREQALENQKILIAMLREKKGEGNGEDTRPPGVFLNKECGISGTTHSTIDKNIEIKAEEQNTGESASPLAGALKIISEIPKQDTPSE